jgi:hypothetical protein
MPLMRERRPCPVCTKDMVSFTPEGGPVKWMCPNERTPWHMEAENKPNNNPWGIRGKSGDKGPPKGSRKGIDTRAKGSGKVAPKKKAPPRSGKKGDPPPPQAERNILGFKKEPKPERNILGFKKKN